MYESEIPLYNEHIQKPKANHHDQRQDGGIESAGTRKRDKHPAKEEQDETQAWVAQEGKEAGNSHDSTSQQNQDLSGTPIRSSSTDQYNQNNDRKLDPFHADGDPAVQGKYLQMEIYVHLNDLVFTSLWD